MHWIEVIFRFLFAWIDKIIAWVIVQSYNLFELIADTNVFNEDVIKMFNRRVYALLAIFMLFKLSFSLVNYIVNPNDFSDQSKGFSKLITNVFVMLIALIAVPYVFAAAYELQGIIIGKNTIQKIVLGVGAGGDEEVDSGQMMAFIVYSAFITPNPDFPNMGNKCDEIYFEREISNECEGVIRDEVGNNEVTILRTALDQYDAQSLLDYDLVVHAKKDGKFLFSYTPIISSICAGIVAWIILLFCIDVSVRVVKLGFLQLIAPIPIISYIDPKSSKDGMFKKWTKVCFSTYADVFVRLMAISFALFIINIIGKGEMTRISDPREFIKLTTHPFVKIFIMLGALLFAKQLPKLITDLTGIELSGKFTMSPIKRVAEAPLIGGAASSGMSYGKNVLKNAALATVPLGRAAWHKMRNHDDKASRIMDDTRTKFSRRMDAAGTEARGRWSASGITGTDNYTGDTASSILRKEKEDVRSKRKSGRLSLKEAQELHEIGTRSNTIKLDYSSDAAIKATYHKVFKHEEFIKSKIEVDKAKDKLKDYEQEYALIQAKLNADPTNSQLAADLRKAREKFNKQSKAVNANEKIHEYVSQIYTDDAKIEKARSIAKGPKPPKKK